MSPCKMIQATETNLRGTGMELCVFPLWRAAPSINYAHDTSMMEY